MNVSKITAMSYCSEEKKIIIKALNKVSCEHLLPIQFLVAYTNLSTMPITMSVLGENI